MRIELPNRRRNQSIDIKVGQTNVHITFGYDEKGTLSEIFIDSHKVGTDIRELLATTAMLISSGLQHGMPIDAIVGMLRHQSKHSVSCAIADLLEDPTIQALALVMYV